MSRALPFPVSDTGGFATGSGERNEIQPFGRAISAIRAPVARM